MTKEEAIIAMNDHKLWHPFMIYKWLTKGVDGSYYNDRGIKITRDELLETLGYFEEFKDGWEIYPESDRSIG